MKIPAMSFLPQPGRARMVLTRYFETARHLKLCQIYGRARARIPRMPPLGPAPPLRMPAGCLEPPATNRKCRTGPFRFRFLNVEAGPDSWNDPRLPKLWLYNLHYFDEPDCELAHRWIRENAPGAGAGWEPYPTSLRIANWIRWLLREGGNAECENSLACQVRYLRRHIEYHILANHLIANARALIYAGSFFAGAEADDWLAAGLRILDRQIPEQVLPDGAHFERSPMYHSIVLEHLLDLINLSRVYPDRIPVHCIEVWRETASRMLGWLNTMCHPDGEIAFFNDAAFGCAPPPCDLEHYASRLGIHARHAAPCSGYLRLEAPNTVCLFDAAPIGPDYQPGHAHSDTLSFELSHRGRRLIVNSGTSTYQAGPRRTHERSTAAHNTVEIDGRDQSEVWGSFRCARRARPFGVRWEQSGQCSFAEASHDGYRRLPDPVVHRRALRLTPDRLEVTDRIEARAFHTIKIFFHLHPDVSRDDTARIRLDPKFGSELEDSAWSAEFGKSAPNKVLVGTWNGNCPVEFTSYIVLN